MIVGMDFGTTNSGMAVYDGRAVRVLPLDPSNTNPRVLPTAVYITNEQAVTIGRAAIDLYYEHNIGRAVKLRKVWVGELEVFGGDMYYVTDSYAFVDVLSPGRLFLSVKTSLRDESYAGTVVGQFFYSLENLITLYLTAVKIRAEQQLGQELRQIVLGRPVRFAKDPEHDQLAQARLLQAAFRAGYEKVYFQYEPIAAAYSYETTIDRPQNVLIFDFGGGTLDITIMRLGDPANRNVLATGGIPVAGDVFDQKLVRAKLPRHFGEGSLYGERHKSLTTPKWIYDSFSDWQKLLELQTADNRHILEDIARTARRRYQIEMLLSLVSSNYGLKLFDIVEEAKKQLSERRGAEILLDGPGFHVRDFVTRTEFEGIIRSEIRAIEEHLQETVAASGLQPGQIDAVIRTGGSSQIPAFNEMLGRLFGPEKVQAIDTFSSVTAGLGVIAHGIEAGEIEAQSYTPGAVKLPATAYQPRVSPINLELVQRRIVMTEGGVEDGGETAVAPDSGPQLVLLAQDGEIFTQRRGGADGPGLVEWGGGWPVAQALVADVDEPLLLITTHYRFLLMTPRQLADAQRLNLKLGDLHKLERGEHVCALASWAALSQSPKLLLVTSSGLARPYPINVLQSNIQAPVPFKFDHALDGVVAAALGAKGNETLAMTTRDGRAVRWLVGDLRGSGTQAINLGNDDRVTSAVLARPTDELVVVLADGYGRRLRVEWLFEPGRPNQKGKSLAARKSEVVGTAVWSPERPLQAITTTRFLPLDAGKLPLEDSTKTQPLINLEQEEMVSGLLAL
ncbi:MAG: Hsp70 family protein [Chloroflexi bacterium]|nr:Hsp70 family protein [Chloroflexota bacterium]MBP7044192.1 Hsp70 family protein [Chloroflexota bacterium]